MQIKTLTVNHGTTPYLDLMLRSLIVHHRQYLPIDVLVLDNNSEDIKLLDWTARFGVMIQETGYSRDSRVNTHGEILRDAVLSHANCDAYLFLDPDICFIEDNTIGDMALELDNTPDAFAVTSSCSFDGSSPHLVTTESDLPPLMIKEERKSDPLGPWRLPLEYNVVVGERVPPHCTLIRNDLLFRQTVGLVGLSGAHHECLRGGLYWDTLGLLTQVMKTHARVWVRCNHTVIHFGSTSYFDTAEKRGKRDALLNTYRLLF